MTRASIFRAMVLVGLTCATSVGVLAQPNKYARDPKQLVDEDYTKKIKEYTTEPFFLSPLVDYLPASKTVPTPKAVLGDVAGAPGKLPYSAEVHAYMRMLEKASPGRVKVFSIGKSEEGREMIAVAIAAEPVLAKLDENRARLAKLADPRTIKLDDAEADRLVNQSLPVYYITGVAARAGNRLADGPDGTGLPPGRRRQPVHQGHQVERHHDDHARAGNGRP